MEARRTFQGEVKSSRIWIVVAALLAAIALGLAGGYAAKGVSTVRAPAKVNVVQPLLPAAPDTRDSIPAPLPYSPSHKRLTVF